MAKKWIAINLDIPDDYKDEIEYVDSILNQLLQWKMFYKSTKTRDYTHNMPFSLRWEYVDDVDMVATEVSI